MCTKDRMTKERHYRVSCGYLTIYCGV